MGENAPTTRRPEDGVAYLEDPTDASRRSVGAALLGIAWKLVFPWIGPVGYWLALGPRRSDVWELAGVLVLPAILCLVGMYFAHLDREHARRIAAKGPATDRALKLHARASAASLVMLAVFEAGMVIAISTWRWNEHERDIASGIFNICIAAYVLHAALALGARHILRRIEKTSRA